MTKIKPIAIHLPQFHPTPENDTWWGKGFTEWTNVSKAPPRFKGHYQPHLPADLGFYDLRLEEARLAQEAAAKKYGIYGFCYYHYWFNGKRMLYEPLDRKLQNPEEDFPFMLSWANENWTRAWDGMDKEMLLEQKYNDEDDVAHMKFLCHKYFIDKRYIRQDDKPVFLVYRPKLFLDINKTISIWRDVARAEGIGELHIGYMQSWGVNEDPAKMGFDFAVEFQPNLGNFPIEPFKIKSFLKRVVNKLKRTIYPNNQSLHHQDTIVDYAAFAELQKKTPFNTAVSPCITPMWDNSPRRKKNAVILTNSTPQKYGDWLQYIVSNYPWKENKEKYLFINAWNEWAEGNHLEPCQKWGNAYLEKTHQVINK